MRSVFSFLCLAVLAACSSSTDNGPTRYNFAVIDGKNQASVAGTATLSKPITSQITRDPHGEFASAAIRFLLPTVAYAQQTLSLPGEPVANAIVCGEETAEGEPKVVPLCAFTLTDGKAANTVEGGTKAGVFTLRFTAQLPTESPVTDSTTVVVEPGPFAKSILTGGTFNGLSPFEFDNGPMQPGLQDQFGNRVPYRLEVTGPAHVLSDTLGVLSARTVVADTEGLCSDTCNGDFRAEEWGTVSVVTADGVIATAKLHVGYANPGWLITLGQF